MHPAESAQLGDDKSEQGYQRWDICLRVRMAVAPLAMEVCDTGDIELPNRLKIYFKGLHYGIWLNCIKGVEHSNILYVVACLWNQLCLWGTDALPSKTPL